MQSVPGGVLPMLTGNTRFYLDNLSQFRPKSTWSQQK